MRTAVTVALVWAALAALYLRFEAAPWLLGLFALFTLPALWDLVANPSAGLTCAPDALHWHSGRRDGEVAWSQIDHVRLDTRLDFSVRASLLLKTGRRVRLPFEATPDPDTFEAALKAQGIRVERHHFSLLG